MVIDVKFMLGDVVYGKKPRSEFAPGLIFYADIPKMTENKMGVMPVNKLLISMSLPMMLSMLIQACYNVVDSMFVARIGEDALAAVSLAFPVQNLMISVGIGTAVGINALLSRSLGEKNFDRVGKVACNGIFLAALSFLAFALFGLFFARPFFEMQTGVPEIVEYGVSYLSICSVFSFGIFGQLVFGRLLQSTGKTFYAMVTQGVGAILNIVLDPIMIFGLFGCPRMGVAGAAAATVIGQIAACLLSIYFNFKKNREVRLHLENFRLNMPIIRSIYAVGVPSIIMMSLGSVMVFAMNKIMIGFSTTAAAFFGVYFKLQSFVFMPIFGLNNGMVPIVAYNYGAKKRERIVETVRLGIFYAMGIMLFGLAVFWIFPEQLLACFNASPAMLSIGVPAMRVISLSYILAGFPICTLTICLALGRGVESLAVAAVRQLVFLLPGAFILARLGGLNAVWWCFPFAEISAVILSAALLRRIYLQDIADLGADRQADLAPSPGAAANKT